MKRRSLDKFSAERFLQIERPMGQVHEMAAEIRQRAAAKSPPMAPIDGQIIGAVGPLRGRADYAELLWDMERDGQQLAVVHIVAPHALVVPVEADFDHRYAEEVAPSLADEAEAPVWFYGAKAYWWKYD